MSSLTLPRDRYFSYPGSTEEEVEYASLKRPNDIDTQLFETVAYVRLPSGLMQGIGYLALGYPLNSQVQGANPKFHMPLLAFRLTGPHLQVHTATRYLILCKVSRISIIGNGLHTRWFCPGIHTLFLAYACFLQPFRR